MSDYVTKKNTFLHFSEKKKAVNDEKDIAASHYVTY